MRRSYTVLLLVVLSVVPVSLLGQQSPQTVAAPQRDQQAISILQQAFAAMGKTLPSDSVTTGTVTIVAGSRTESGSIRILTRGPDQSLEEIQTEVTHRIVVYSRYFAAETNGSTTKALSVELSASSQCPDFPMPLVSWALNSSDAGVSYVGLETVNGESMHHIRVWNAFVSIPALQSRAEFSIHDLWIDSARFLPRKISYLRRTAGGAVPRIPVEVYFSDFQEISGIFYPFTIQKIFNGTPWTTISISKVSLNTGLSDSDFPVSSGSEQ